MSRHQASRIRPNAVVGETIRAKRLEAKHTLRSLGEVVGVAYNTVQKIEEGIAPCPLHLLTLFAHEFDCSLDELVPVITDGDAA